MRGAGGTQGRSVSGAVSCGPNALFGNREEGSVGQVHPHSAYRGSSQTPQIPAASINWGGGGEQWGNTGHKVNVMALGSLGGPPHGQEPPTMGGRAVHSGCAPPPQECWGKGMGRFCC